MWSHGVSILNQLPPASIRQRMHDSIKFLDSDRLPLDCVAPRCVESAQPTNRDKCYRRLLESCVTRWWVELLQRTLDSSRAVGIISRQVAHLGLHLGDLRKPRNAYQPAHYLKCAHPAQLDLLRLWVQACSRTIPCHRYYPMNGLPRVDYADRCCPFCLPTNWMGDELHTIIESPNSNQTWLQFLEDFKLQTRLLDLPPFSRMPPPAQLAIALGNPPPTLLKKDCAIWLARIIPVSSRFAGALRRQLPMAPMSHLPTRAGHLRKYRKRSPAPTPAVAPSNQVWPPNLPLLPPMRTNSQPQMTTLLVRCAA